MSLKERERGSFVHPKQEKLFRLINNGHHLPIGAEELIREAIREYDQAFDPNFQLELGIEDMDTDLIVEIPHASPDADIVGGTFQRLGVKFEANKTSQKIVPAFFVPVTIEFKSSPQTPIYPDRLRYVGVDVHGNSKSAIFMFAVPEDLTGKFATIVVNASNGMNHSSNLDFLVK